MNWIRLLAIGLMLALPGLAEAGEKTLHNAATANADGGNISVTDKGMVGLTVTISGTATVTPQGSADQGTTYTTFSCLLVGGTTSASSITATGQYLCPVSGLSHFKAPLSGCSACTVTVKVNTSQAGGGSGAGDGFLSSILAILTDVWNSTSHFLSVSLATLISGEDQTNNLLMTSGGVTRLTTFSSVDSATSSSVTTVPTGPKTFVGVIAAGASESTAFALTVYGNWTNSTTAAIPVCTISIPAVTTTAILQEACPSTNANYMYWFYTVTVYTSASGKDVTVYAQY